MKSCLLVLALGLVGPAFALPVEVGGLPPWTLADTEVSTNVPFAFAQASVRDLLLELGFAGTPSNCVQVAFGRDANADGLLDADEVGMDVGWDCGRWVLRTQVEGLDGVERGKWTALPVTTNAAKRLAFDLRTSRSRAKGLVAAENGVPVEWPLPERLPEGLYRRQWNMLRLTVRGVDAAEPGLRAELNIAGMAVIWR